VALVKIAELKGVLEVKAEREVNLETYRDEDKVGESLRACNFVTCINCGVKVEFENFVPVLEGEGVTACPSCSESLTELAE
jgi:hypothetical protein